MQTPRNAIARMLLLATGWLFWVGTSYAAVIGLPAKTESGNCIPFGCALGITRYQEVYSRAEFSGPLEINEIDFFAFANDVFPLGNLASGTFTLSLSTTSMPVGGLDNNFLNNIGADNTVFDVAVLTGGAASSVLSFLGGAFFYDPAAGNLLLDIQISGASHAGTNTYFQTPLSTVAASRLYTDPPFVSQDTGGPLVTGFVSLATVPEPPTFALFVLGIVGFGISRRYAFQRRS
jgi:hypothetical protein